MDSLSGYHAYLLTGLVAHFMWLLFHKKTQQAFKEGITEEPVNLVLFIIFYAHIYPIDYVVSAFRAVFLKTKFADL